MKKIVSPLANGGAPYTNELMETVFNQEIWTAMQSILAGISDSSASGNVGVIVSGCKVTLNGGGPNYDCSSGIVYLNGQFMAFAGFVNQPLPLYITPATPTYTSAVFNDGTTNQLTVEQDATYTNVLPGSGQYISLTTTGNLGGPGGNRVENYQIISAGTKTNAGYLLTDQRQDASNNCNNFTTGSFQVAIQSSPNAPSSTGSQIFLIYTGYDVTTSGKFQIAFTISGGGTIYSRFYAGGSWGSWTAIN